MTCHSDRNFIRDRDVHLSIFLLIIGSFLKVQLFEVAIVEIFQLGIERVERLLLVWFGKSPAGVEPRAVVIGTIALPSTPSTTRHP